MEIVSRHGTERRVPEDVRRVICAQVPGRAADALPDALPLGAEGLGLDSVGVVELVLACETRFDVALPAQLFDGHPLTVGTLIEQVAQALAACRPGEASREVRA